MSSCGERLPLANLHRRLGTMIVAAGKSVPSLIRVVDKKRKPTLSFHDLRRSCITPWMARVYPQTLHQPAGHADIKTTMAFQASVTDDQIELARRSSQLAASTGRQEQIANEKPIWAKSGVSQDG